MTAAAVDVTLHARTRWLQRICPDDPFPAASIREAFQEAADLDAETQIRRYHQELGILFIAVERDAVELVITVYETAAGGGE